MLLHLLFLSVATVLTWLWTQSPTLSFYNLQLIAGLVVLYFVKNIRGTKIRNTKYEIRNKSKILNSNILNSERKQLLGSKFINHNSYFINQSVDAIILTVVVLLLVFSTGGIASPLFFLLYFLLFGISFLFEPFLAVFFSLILILFMIVNIGSPQDLLKVASLIFVAPIALFFGQQYLQNLVSQNRIKIFQKKWLEDEKTIESEETSVLFWLSLNFRNRIAEIIEITANLLTDLAHISPTQKAEIKKIRRKAKILFKEGKLLQKKIDRETDSQS